MEIIMNGLVARPQYLEQLMSFRDKLLIKMDFTPNASHNGIKQINALDWLLGQLNELDEI